MELLTCNSSLPNAQRNVLWFLPNVDHTNNSKNTLRFCLYFDNWGQSCDLDLAKKAPAMLIVHGRALNAWETNIQRYNK
jgi:hypothetical protein